ncbi:MAG: hypothetical protein P4L57_04540 [Rhizomicrobium sp.]|nr:hypothetical protein [Rhizomicrobium sp.]
MRFVLAAAVFVSLTLPVGAKTHLHAPSSAAPAEYEALKQAAEMCSAKGAFGRSFARSGRVDTTADEEWAPFTKLSLTSAAIRAEASFHGSGETLAEDIEQAEDFRQALEKAITAKHLFAHSKKQGKAMVYSANEDGSGLSFVLDLEEDHVIALCSER